MSLTYTDYITDTTFSGLPTPGLVPSGSGQAGMLVSNATQVVTSVTFSITPRTAGQLFDGSLVRAGFLRDFDGVNCEPPLIDGPHGSFPFYPGKPNSIVKLTPPVPMLQELNRALKVGAEIAPSFRFYILNSTPIDLVVQVLYRQGA
jgi:hypothetical protein